MPWGRALVCIASIGAIAALCGCATVERFVKPNHYIDLQFPVGTSGSQQYPHVVDNGGALWYVDGDRIVRAAAPSLRQTVRDEDAKAGRLFWYDGAVYVLAGDGSRLTRFGSKLQADPSEVPSHYAPSEGVVADARHRWLVFAQERRHELAVVDEWKWYDESVNDAIDPFAAALAGGPKGKKYLVVADATKPIVAVKNRHNGRSVVIDLPDNACFSIYQHTWRVPVDVRGRDDYRTWATAGGHALSIDLSNKHILRVWELDGCAMRILGAGPDAATILLGTRHRDGYVTSVIRVDREGVHPLAQYGTVDGLAGGAWIDRYDRLWWFDAKTHAFVCRTPLA